jgi:uncharacterized protein YoxC
MLTTFIILDALIAVQVLIIIATAVVLFAVLGRTMKILQSMRESVVELLPRVDELLIRVNDLIKASEPIGGKAADISADVQKMVETTRGSVENISGTVNDISFRVRNQAERVDSVITENLNRLEKLSSTMAENFAMPMAEISAVLRGGYAAAKYLRRQKAPASQGGDGHEQQQTEIF